MPVERLQKVLAEAGVASRRGSEALIAAGRVTVDGRVATVGERVDRAAVAIAVDGRAIASAATMPRTYLAVHKPAGVTSTVRDRHASRTVIDLVPREVLARAGRLYPVGRLDLDSEGLILLSNDGEWTERVLHPRHAIEREYAIGLARPLLAPERIALEAGIELDEGRAVLEHLRPMTGPETTALGALLDPRPGPLAWYRATLRQGWKRQLRRMFGSVGRPIERLVRVRVGTVRLDGLRAGELRVLSAREARAAAAAPTGILPAMDEAASSRSASRANDRPRLVVALDGPGSSGKSTVGAAAARELGYRFCDTGLLYRAVTWLALDRGVDLGDADALVALVAEVTLATDPADPGGRLDRVLVDGRDVSDRVRTAGIDERVSEVARVPAVRAALLGRQRALAEGGGIIMAGRDIGTIVLPGADLKLYLDASAEERAHRRASERGLADDDPAARRILDDLRRRDRIDSTRAVAPLRVAADAVRLVSDGLELEQTVALVVEAVRSAEAAGR